ncbi:MAG TPA: hypothetical protein VLB69_04835 [Rudaea sp.]|nr:hypothetical protein [Rudaea sp.]
MSTHRPGSITNIAAACALSLVSAAAFAGPGGRGGGAAAMHETARTSVPAMRGGVAGPTMRPGTASTTATTARPAATTARTTTRQHATGQPNASCEDTPNQPGHSISAPGSAFNPEGIAGTKYAGEQPQNSRNPDSVSQYDVACTRPTH